MSDILKNAGSSPADDTIVTLLSRVVSDAGEVARAEVDLQKAKVFSKISEAKSGVMLALVAVVLALLALIALVVGILMILTPLVGPIWATVIVVGVLLVLAGIFAMIAMGRFKAMVAAPGASA
jgi:uncharacterized membrane protein YqjE